ncbi:MAG: hypothetical protein KDD15_24870 [Lewinella sp.]|nr:hypothetical protein [Lewinella sp.]
MQKNPLDQLRTRLAPTPSGYLHLGNAISFVATWALARARQGWILLRIDDLDATRRRPEYLEDIFETLEWLGLDYDDGPSGPDDFLQNYSQQLRLPYYQKALEALLQTGDVYGCTCSRKQIQAAGTDGHYPGTCRLLARDLHAPKTAWRVSVTGQTEVCFTEWRSGKYCLDPGREMGDFVIRQKNGAPAYQIASLVDDRHWEINFVVRGEDLRASTAAQMYLANRMEFTGFQQATFWHHGLITDPAGRKLSKSEGAAAMKSWREENRSPLEVFSMAAQWLGVVEEIGSGPELIDVLRVRNEE